MHEPEVLYKALNGGFEQFSSDVFGVDGDAKTFSFSSYQIIKLVSEQRNSQHRNSMVHCLEQAVLTSMGDKKTH